MPRGRLPTGIVATVFCAATSTTLMSPPLSFVTNRRPMAGTDAAGAGEAAGPGGASADEQAHDKVADSSRMARRMAHYSPAAFSCLHESGRLRLTAPGGGRKITNACVFSAVRRVAVVAKAPCRLRAETSCL